MDATAVRFRLQALRERHDLNQEQLAKKLGFKDRQTLSQIELGERKLAPDEMVRAAQVFGVPIDYFTDPFELAGEGKFSWRQSNADADALNDFEARAGQWIAAYRHLSRLRGDAIHSLTSRVALTSRSQFEEATAEGEAISATLGLGAIPSAQLPAALQDKLGTLVLYVDTVPGVSGAACRLNQLNAVLVNRHEPAVRRAFNLAHELFHLLTWHEMPPAHVENTEPTSRNRVEQLADNFAAGLLIPTPSLHALLGGNSAPRGPGLAAWLKASAATLGVSGQALKWRLVSAGFLKKAEAEAIPDALLRSDRDSDPEATPGRFSRRFVGLIGWAIDEGHVSVRRVAKLLGLSVDDLEALFAEHGLATPFDL